MFSLIVLSESCGAITDENGNLPKIPQEMTLFKKITYDNIVIMGRRTWESIPINHRPLPNRLNVIVSSQGERLLEEHEKFQEPLNRECIKLIASPMECLQYFSKNKKKYKNRELFVIGGSYIYNWFLNNNLIQTIYFSHLKFKQIRCGEQCAKKIKIKWKNMDSFEDLLTHNEWKCEHSMLIKETNEYICRHYKLNYINKEESIFLDNLKDILENGYEKMDRTGTGTFSLFGKEIHFDLTDNKFPLLTTRLMPLRLIFEELMWFLRGQTDSKILEEKNVNIWRDNTTREFLDSRGLNHYDIGDMGASYSFQYRYNGIEYKDCYTDYSSMGGYDQLRSVVDQLINNPDSRRIMINLWIPSDLDKMALPPCLFCFQFYVTPNGGLITKATQRSSDISLAGGWNIATTALLTYILAYYCNLTPEKIIWSTGDTHIYLNQIESVKKQLSRTPYRFPKLFIKNSAPKLYKDENKRIKFDKNTNFNIIDFEYSDLELLNYKSHPSIKINMNA